jgi:hypothetical protein
MRLGISFLDDRNAADSTQYDIEVGEGSCALMENLGGVAAGVQIDASLSRFQLAAVSAVWHSSGETMEGIAQISAIGVDLI